VTVLETSTLAVYTFLLFKSFATLFTASIFKSAKTNDDTFSYSAKIFIVDNAIPATVPKITTFIELIILSTFSLAQYFTNLLKKICTPFFYVTMFNISQTFILFK